MRKRGAGTVEWRGDCWKVRVSNPKGKHPARPWIPLLGIARADRALAEHRGAIVAARAHDGLIPVERGETVSEWFARWYAWRKTRGISGGVGQFAKWAEKAIGHLPMAGVKGEHVELVRYSLDAAIVSGEITWKTANNVWSFVCKGFKDAVMCKNPLLRGAIPINPCAGLPGPEKGQDKAKQFLYPNELLLLLSCEGIPLWRRRVYAFAVYSYMRVSEIAALLWDDVDAIRGTILVHQSVDRSGPRNVRPDEKGTKTQRSRRFNAEPEILPMLQAMHAEAKDCPQVFPKLPPANGCDGAAPTLRADLLRAGVKRASLHKATKTLKRIGFHDLRATACTWAAIRGDSPIKIMGRSGHETLQVLMTYVREAENVREGFGAPFPALPACLMAPGENCPRTVPTVQKTSKNVGKKASPTGFESLWKSGESQPISARSSPSSDPELSNGVSSSGRVTEALARALELAAAEGKWEVVSELSRQLAMMRQPPPSPVRLVAKVSS
jgi:integrase